MSHVTPETLDNLYAQGDDPWQFRTRGYERDRFRSTVEALPSPRYASALEVGCGNGELAALVAPRCSCYAGVDAVETALAAARRAVPAGRFARAFLPAPLPDGDHDLILLSEILYFLSPEGIADLAAQIDRRWPAADVLCATWLGPSGNPLEGPEALQLYLSASRRRFACLRPGPGFRLDLATGGGRA